MSDFHTVPHMWTSMTETHDTYKGHDIFHDYERLRR